MMMQQFTLEVRNVRSGEVLGYTKVQCLGLPRIGESLDCKKYGFIRVATIMRSLSEIVDDCATIDAVTIIGVVA
jgi:hypothetical protein